MVLMEAQQMGVPVLALDSFGSLHDIIEDGINGRIVPNNDLKTFAGAMKELMREDNLRQKMSYDSVELSKRFVIDKILQNWLQLFKELQENR